MLFCYFRRATTLGGLGGTVGGPAAAEPPITPCFCRFHMPLSTMNTPPLFVRNVSLSLICTLLGMFLSSRAAHGGIAPPSYTLTDVSSLFGIQGGVGTAINDSGQVAGWYGATSGSITAIHSFLYIPGGTVQDLGTLPGYRDLNPQRSAQPARWLALPRILPATAHVPYSDGKLTALNAPNGASSDISGVNASGTSSEHTIFPAIKHTLSVTPTPTARSPIWARSAVRLLQPRRSTTRAKLSAARISASAPGEEITHFFIRMER